MLYLIYVGFRKQDTSADSRVNSNADFLAGKLAEKALVIKVRAPQSRFETQKLIF
jgi:hypothetical protein